MKKFIVCDNFLDIFPNAHFGVVVARNTDNVSHDSEVYEAMLREAERASATHSAEEPFTQNPVVAEWREAFKQFKTKKGARASVEALLKRVKNGQNIGSISPLVDIYNSISLKYGLSCGGEDIDSFAGDLKLTLADGTEEFYLIGSDENEPPAAGEIVYKDDAGAVCRCFNWRDGKRTMLTDNSKNAFLIIEMTNGKRVDDLKQAISEMADLIERHTGAKTERFFLSAENKHIIIDE